MWAGLWPWFPVPVAQHQSVSDGCGSRWLSASPWQWAGGRPEPEVKEGELSFLLLWTALGRWSHSASGHQEGKITPLVYIAIQDLLLFWGSPFFPITTSFYSSHVHVCRLSETAWTPSDSSSISFPQRSCSQHFCVCRGFCLSPPHFLWTHQTSVHLWD